MKKTSKIRNEIRLRRLDLISKGENENNALNIARTEANIKYGEFWRDQDLINQ